MLAKIGRTLLWITNATALAAWLALLWEALRPGGELGAVGLWLLTGVLAFTWAVFFAVFRAMARHRPTG